MKNRPEVIHAGGFLVGGFAALVAKKCFGIPWILYAHGEDIHSQAESRTLGRYLRWIFTSADAVIANSKFTRQLLTEKVGVNPKRIHLVNPGLDAKFFIRPDSVEAVQKKYGLVGKQALFTLGRLTPRKGHKQLIKALPSIIAEHPNLILVIASEGEERVNLEKMVSRMGLDQWVVFTGSVSDTEQVALYHACDIFILANRNLKNDVEGFGMVFLEAGAAGKPVIGGRSGGAVEAIREGRTGFLVDTEKPANIGDKISLLLDNAKLRAQLGQHGIAHARQFLWETQVPKITAIINQITKEISP